MSPLVKQSAFWEKFFLWNLQFWALESRFQLWESGMPPTIEIRNPLRKIRNTMRGIRNPRLYWITLQGGVNETICVLYNKYISVVFWHRRHHQLLLSVYLTYPTHDTKEDTFPRLLHSHSIFCLHMYKNWSKHS